MANLERQLKENRYLIATMGKINYPTSQFCNRKSLSTLIVLILLVILHHLTWPQLEETNLKIMKELPSTTNRYMESIDKCVQFVKLMFTNPVRLGQRTTRFTQAHAGTLVNHWSRRRRMNSYRPQPAHYVDEAHGIYGQYGNAYGRYNGGYHLWP